MEQTTKTMLQLRKKMWTQIPNPIPKVSTIEEFFAHNY
jgi:hypothetical protein